MGRSDRSAEPRGAGGGCHARGRGHLTPHEDDWKRTKASKPPRRGGILKSILKFVYFCSDSAEG
jgi:hypothetical protein